MSEPCPPRVASMLLASLLPRSEREFLLGDLAEQYTVRVAAGRSKAILWYWSQAIRSVLSFRIPRNRLPRKRMNNRQSPGQALLADIKYAVRSLRRAPGFALIAILTLAIGIGANTAIFSVVNAVVLRRLPFEQPEQLMRAYLLMPPALPGEARIDMTWSFPKYETLREAQDIFQSLATFSRESYTLADVEQSERIVGEMVASEYFDVLGVSALMGRTFLAEEDTPGGSPVAALSYDMWRGRYAGSQDAIGKTIRLDNVVHRIVGVLPAGFRGLSGAAEVFVSTSSLSPSSVTNPNAHNQSVIARLRPGVSVARAKAEMATVGRRIDEAWPDSRRGANWSARARALEEVRAEPVIRTSLLLLMGAVGFVLLIACVNLANLLLGRAATRQREVAIRLSVGASRGRISKQLLTESTVLAVAGGAAGLLLAFPAVWVLRRIAPQASGSFAEDVSGLTRMGMDAISIDTAALLFTLGVTLITGIVFGLIPALQASRPDLTNALKEGGGGRGATSRGVGTREVLVVAELALAFVLLVGSGLMIKSFGQMQNTQMGFEARNVLTVGLSLPGASYDRTAGHRLVETLHERITSLPGVLHVGFNICTPLSSGCNGTGIQLLDRPETDPAARTAVEIHAVSPDYFAALGIPLIRGRVFNAQDRQGARGVALIDETAARQFWPNDDPTGKMVLVGQGDGGEREIIGVVGDVRYDAVNDLPFPTTYIPYLQSTRRSGFTIIRTAGDPLSLVTSVRQILRNIDPDLPLFDVKTMEQRMGDATSGARFSALLLSTYSAISLILAAIGVYGVLSYAVTQRTQEIGLRMALGAERATILKLVVARALTMAGVGLGVGLAAAWALSRLIGSVLYEVRPNDPATFGVVTLVLAGLAIAASYLPARRASMVDPIIALRQQ